MSEHDFKTFVKSALEDGIAVSPERLHAIEAVARQTSAARLRRTLFLRWAPPVLAAAVLTVALALRTTFLHVRSGDGSARVADAIGLLCELDDIRPECLDDSSTPDLLASWQEAPCADLL